MRYPWWVYAVCLMFVAFWGAAIFMKLHDYTVERALGFDERIERALKR